MSKDSNQFLGKIIVAFFSLVFYVYRYWWIRIQVLSEKSLWDELEKLSLEKRNPLGFEPFVEVALKQNRTDEVKKYILKCKVDKRAKWYIRAGLPEDAAVILYNQRDINGLWSIHEIASKLNNENLVKKIQNFITEISPKI